MALSNERKKIEHQSVSYSDLTGFFLETKSTETGEDKEIRIK